MRRASVPRARLFMAGVLLLGACFATVLLVSFTTAYPAEITAGVAHDETEVPVPLDKPALYTCEILKTFPHDPNAFTQGLLYYKNDTLYESTGMYGESTIRTVDLETGNVLRKRSLPAAYFAEGLALWGNRLLQLTWLTNEGFAYARRDLKPVARFRTPLKDGWGLSNDDTHLIASDGSNKLYFLDPQTFEEVKRLEIVDGGLPVYDLNELEYIEGEIWANIWQRECIVRIDPGSGRVTGWVVLDGLKAALEAERIPQNRRMDVLNGIAYDAKRRRLFITGKYWPRMYQVRVKAVDPSIALGLDSVRDMCIIRRT